MRWIRISGFNYSVREDGAVKRTAEGSSTWIGRRLKHAIDKDGYHTVTLSIPGFGHRVVKVRKVHALVALAFVGPRPSSAHQVNHLDGCKDNNHWSNLEWSTPGENQKHSIRLGLKRVLIGSENRGAKLTEAKVKKAWKLRQKGWNQRRIAERLGVHYATIYCVFSGKTWTHVGHP